MNWIVWGSIGKGLFERERLHGRVRERFKLPVGAIINVIGGVTSDDRVSNVPPVWIRCKSEEQAREVAADLIAEEVGDGWAVVETTDLTSLPTYEGPDEGY